jgi:hypothetical protein
MLAQILALPLALAVALGPPWISIEYPGNPLDRNNRDAYLLVHTYHHQTPTEGALRGEAVTWVNGQRRATPLRFGETGRTGVYKVTKQWADGTPYVLVITYGANENDAGVTALVSVDRTGTVARVEIPKRAHEDFFVPRPVSQGDITQAFRAAGGAS